MYDSPSAVSLPRRPRAAASATVLRTIVLGLVLFAGAGLLPEGARAQVGGGFGPPPQEQEPPEEEPPPEETQEEADPVPRIAEAESVFQQALSAFEAGDYGMAFRRFQIAENSYPLHRKTTAAALMAAKALYRQGEYTRADERLSTFLREYPSSSYVGAARRVRDLARQQLGLEAGGAQETVQLGIALPLTDQDVSLTQAMFNGIALAVTEQNGEQGDAGQEDAASGPRVRMIFRDTEGDPDGARAAVQALAEAGADVVVGPLYSRTARPAGAVAEEERVPMIAPLATEQGVSQGRRYVFQANPTIAMRGRQMGLFALQSLRLERFGIVSQPEGTLSYRLAEGFRAAVERQGGEVMFAEALPDLRAWGNLNERISADSLGDVDAMYMPVSGEQAGRRVQAVLTAMDRASVPRLRILGNGEWHDLPIEGPASRYRVTYSNAFRIDPTAPAVQAFVERYGAAHSETPDQLTATGRRLAYTGYDVARFFLEARKRPQASDAANPPALPDLLREVPRYEGLGMRIDFETENVNEALFFQRYRDGRVELLQ